MAVHEAGHQVMAVALSIRSKGVVLLEDAGHSFDAVNRARYIREEMRYWDLLEKEIQILLAGECAVRLFYERIGDDSDAYGSEGDRAAVAPLLSELAAELDEGVNGLLLRREQAVIDALDGRWAFVESLADELLAQGKLNGEQVLRVLREMPAL